MLPRDDGIGWFNKILGNDIAIRQEKWVYKIGENNIATGMVAMKDKLVAEGFDHKHPIVKMCGGIPLAVRCMLSAVAQERQKQAHQGIHAKACDVQDEIEKHVKEYGIQNTPVFEDLTESLQLGFDDLPHHMLKTCLLYCSIYTGGHIFQRHDLVRRWISERFVYKEEEADSYFEELVDRGFNLCTSELFGHLVMHPMMRNFLRWKSRQDNLITCSSEITPSDNTCRIRRICLDNSPCRSRDAAAGPLSALDWNHIRSLVVFEEGFERVPLKRLEGLRVLDICRIKSLQNHHLMDICGLVRLRHLLGLNGDQIIEIPTEIVRLQCLETFQAIGKGFRRLPGFIGNLKLLKTLDMNSTSITELPKEIWSLQQLKTLDIRRTRIRVLPKEIGEMQQLKTLDISRTRVTQLPKEIGRLQQLRTLDISDTSITVLPKEIRKLQHLEHLLMIRTHVGKIPREIGALKELKSLKLDNSVAALPLEACALVKLPECIRQAQRKSDLLSELAREMPSYKKYGGLGGIVVGAKQMNIPMWIREHFNDIALLDISICKLEEEGLKILRGMPKLGDLTLRFHVVPREPVVIRSEGFANLIRLTLDSRVPRVTFQEGAMPALLWLKFLFQFYAGPPNIDPVGVNYLRRLNYIDFICNEDWYVGDSPCIRPTIDIVSREAQELPCLEEFRVCGRKENICRSSPEIEQKSSSKTCEKEEQEESSSGVSEIENIQA
jgi:hypothetical protein